MKEIPTMTKTRVVGRRVRRVYRKDPPGHVRMCITNNDTHCICIMHHKLTEQHVLLGCYQGVRGGPPKLQPCS